VDSMAEKVGYQIVLAKKCSGFLTTSVIILWSNEICS